MTEQISTIEAPEVELTGEEIIEDVCGRLAAELAKSCYLTRLCAYRDYLGKIVAELQLQDFDKVAVTTTVTAGTPDPARPSRRFEIEIPPAGPSEVRERSGLDAPPNLERDVVGDLPVTTTMKRYYTPRRSKSGTAK